MKRKKQKYIVICVVFALIFIYYVCLSCGFFDVTIKEQQSKSTNDNSLCQENTLCQWAIKNNGDFVSNIDSFDISSVSWKDDTPIAVKGIDLNYTDDLINTSPNRDAIIAVIDSDIDISHNILKDNIWANENEIADDGLDNDNNGYIDDINGWNFYNDNNELYNGVFYDGMHGTHIAGVLCLYDSETGYKSLLKKNHIKIMCLKALSGMDGSGNTGDVIRAIEYAEKNGAKICCLSLGTNYYDKNLEEAIRKSEMLFVVAAGNDNKNLDKGVVSYPASFELDNILTVTAIRCDGNLCADANYGIDTVDIAAPGCDIASSVPDNGFEYMSGTSIAVPFVGTAAAIVYCKNEKELNALEIKDILMKTATPLNKLKDKVKSGGMVSYGNLIKYQK